MNEGESSPPFSLSRSFSQYLVGALFFSFYHLFLLRLGPLGSIFLSVDILFFFYISFSFLRFVRARARALVRSSWSYSDARKNALRSA